MTLQWQTIIGHTMRIRPDRHRRQVCREVRQIERYLPFSLQSTGFKALSPKDFF
jgi:hypothetical protein